MIRLLMLCAGMMFTNLAQGEEAVRPVVDPMMHIAESDEDIQEPTTSGGSPSDDETREEAQDYSDLVEGPYVTLSEGSLGM